MNVTPFPTPNDPELPPAAEFDNVAVTPVAKQPRGRSTIEFPYADLNDAVSVARMILDKGGVPLAKDQLAATMGHPVTSGAFVAKLHASRMFGLIEFVMGKSKLTDLGFEVVDSDENRVKAAKVKAFFNVPLFARAYGEFRNRQLPPRNEGLEQALVGFGVLQTRKHNARWAFDRSARQAGFFEHGEDRLVQPVITLIDRGIEAPMSESVEDKVETENVIVVRAPVSAANEDLIRGLLARIPKVGAGWSLAERARWLRALSVNLAMLYGSGDEGEIQITAPKPVQDAPPVRPQSASTPKASEPAPQKAEPKWEPKSGGDLDDDIPF